MARGPAPKEERIRSSAPALQWQDTTEQGWQHGEIPPPPDGLLATSIEAWNTWFGAWFAAFWTPDDLPGLRQVIRLYDQVERDEFQRSAELRMAMDTWGLSPKGRQTLRWRKAAEAETAQRPSSGKRYGQLKAVGD